jgi:hypothetical protein
MFEYCHRCGHRRCSCKVKQKVNINIGGITGLTGATEPTEPKSAFRAINNIIQPVVPNATVQVLYPAEEFDLNNEYNPATSTFTPNQQGVYAIFASVRLDNVLNDDQRVNLHIRVNGGARIFDNEIIDPETGFVYVSGILRLKAGDIVNVFIDTSSGIIQADNTHFEMYRYQSNSTLVGYQTH